MERTPRLGLDAESRIVAGHAVPGNVAADNYRIGPLLRDPRDQSGARERTGRGHVRRIGEPRVAQRDNSQRLSGLAAEGSDRSRGGERDGDECRAGNEAGAAHTSQHGILHGNESTYRTRRD